MNEELYEKYLNGSISESEMVQFKALLENPETSADFFEYVEQDYLMMLVSQEKLMEDEEASAPSVEYFRKVEPVQISRHTPADKKIYYILASCAAVFIFTFLVLALIKKTKQPEIAGDEKSIKNKVESIAHDSKKKSPKDKTKEGLRKRTYREIPKRIANESQQRRNSVERTVPLEKPEGHIIKETEKVNAILTASLDEGNVKVLRSGQELLLKAGEKFFEDDIILSPYESSAVIAFDDKTSIVAAPNSIFVISEHDGFKSVSLNEGNLKFDVTPQQRAMVIKSGEIETKVVGTSLEVERQRLRGHVKVFSGKVLSSFNGKDYELTAGKCLLNNGDLEVQTVFSEHGYKCGFWDSESKFYLTMDISRFLKGPGIYSVYFQQEGEGNPLEISYVELLEDMRIVQKDNHSSLTAPHNEQKRNQGIWEKGPYGLNTYRFYLDKFSNTVPIKLKARIKSSSSKGSVWVNSVPLETGNIVRGEKLGTNLAAGKSVETSNGHSNHGGEFLTDGKTHPSSSWWAQKGENWCIIDLGQIRQIGHVQVFPVCELNSCHFYSVEISRDKKVWKEVADMSIYLPSHINGNTHKTGKEEARFVRVSIKDVQNSIGGIFINEVRVFK